MRARFCRILHEIPAAEHGHHDVVGKNGIDDQGAMGLKYPLMNVYWRNKIPDFSKIQVPMYVTAGWNHFHLRGTIMAYRMAGSKEKWLRAHREFEWPDFYMPENIEDLKRFFDRY